MRQVSMTKIHKAISLSEETYKDIQQRNKHHGFNFSDWVEKQYEKEFLSVEKKQKEKEEYKKIILSLDKEILAIKEREEMFSASLSRTEKRFLLSVPRLLENGMELGAILKRFNVEFNKHYTQKEVRNIIRFLEKNNEKKNRH